MSSVDSEGLGEKPPTRPMGEPYDWFRRAEELIAHQNHSAAAELLAHLVEVEPRSASAREALARALFDSRRYAESAVQFGVLVDLSPDNDYGHFGLGMSMWRLQDFPAARDHLALAAVMRPDATAYSQALAQVRATLRARSEAGMPPAGSVDEDPR